MISYVIEPHDINTLTAPMWDACGIECPAMIGADCPGKELDGTRCPGWSAKFSNAAAEVVHGWTLESFQDDQAGNSVEGDGWFALFRTPNDERHDDNPMGAGVILCELSNGAVQVTRFGSDEELTRDWAKITAEYEYDDEEN